MDFIIEKFLDFYPNISKYALKLFDELPISEFYRKEIVNYYMKCLNYNIEGGKYMRGITLVEVAYKCWNNGDKILWDEVLTAGWCIEILQAFFLVGDDIMDGGEIRRGKVCWYISQGLSMGLNDSFCLYIMSELLMKNALKSYSMDTLARIMDLLHRCIFYTILGQHLDTSPLCLKSTENLDERYFAMIQMKTSYYSIYLPICIGLLLANSTSGIPLEVEHFSRIIGEYLQIENDFLDYFGNNEKTGNDIEQGKLTWLLCKAMQDPLLRDDIVENYGRNAELIKKIYQKLNMESIFEEYKLETKNKVSSILEKLENKNLRKALRCIAIRIFSYHDQKCTSL
ncbi:polyprenyl synthetase family protein [Cryptosporidium andersoni]|uniref:Polyprenyl synthetase family protein n=1 Tax=Cryptosporidium andersoni TaxID=117008 RepID=A0A1J4MTX5_9CRYT|nr:polyprenyl synthetase family protein [Cryptosporidium andersoni]